MAKRMELMVEIGSKLNAKFGAVFSSAQKQVSALDKQIKNLNSKKETFSRYGGGYKQYREEIKKTEEQLKRLEEQQKRTQQLRNLQSGLQSKGEALKQSGANNLKTGAMTAAALTIPVKLALDDEEAFAGVKKVANMENAELMKLKGELQGLTKDIPIVSEGMYEIAEASLQAGIGADKLGEAKIREVSNFTKLTAKTATAMDIAEAQSGEWLATWKQNLKLSNEGVQELADRMNYLSDQNNAKAEDIASIFNKSFGTGKVAGFKESEMIALATSIKAAGVETEQAGTHLDIMIRRLGMGDAASKKTRAALQGLGMDAQKVASEMQKDASGTFLKVLEKIQQLPADKQLGAAVDIFGGDAGKSAAKFVASTDILKKNLKEMEGIDWQGSIDAEFANRSATDMNRLKLSLNSLKIMGIQLGANLAPTFTQLVVSLTPMVDKLAVFISQNPTMVKNIGMAVAGFAAFNLALGAGKIAFGNLLIGGSKAIGLFLKFRNIPVLIGKIGPMIAKIGPALGALSGPVGWVVMAVVGLIAAFVLLYKKSVWFRNGVKQAFSQIKAPAVELANLIKGYLGKAFDKLRQYGTQAIPKIKAAFETMKPVIKFIGKLIVSGIITYIKIWIVYIKIVAKVFKILWPVIKFIAKLVGVAIVSQFKFWIAVIKKIWIVLKLIWNVIKFVGKAIRDYVINEIEKAKDRFNMLKEVGSKIWEVIKVAASKVWVVIKNALKVIFLPLKIAIKAVVGYFKWLGSVFSYIWNGAKEIFKAVWDLIATIVQKAVDKIKAKMAPVIEFIKAKWESLKARIGAVWDSIKLRAQIIFRTIQIAVINFIKDVITKFNDIKTKVMEVIENVKAKFMEGFNYLKALVSGPINAVKAKIGEIISKVSEILNNIKTMFSEAWNTAAGYVETAVGTITTKIGEIISKLEKVIGKVKEAFSPANWTVVANITAKIKEVKEKLDGKYTGDVNYKGGLTWLAERGRELVKYPSGETAVVATKAVHYVPPGTRIYNNSDTEKMLNPKTLNEEEHQAFSKLNSAGGLSQYTDNKFKGTSSVSSTENKTKVSESSGGITIVINNHYGNQTTAQIKETNTDLSQKIKKVLSEEEDRKRRVSLA